MLQVLIPISDNQIFFPKEEYFFPKPIIEVLNKPLIVQVISYLEKSIKPDLFICVIPKSLWNLWSIEKIIALSIKTPVKFFVREDNNSGSICSCLLASDLIEEGEIICANMDEIMDINLDNIINDFKAKQSDSGLILYPASHPRLGYAVIDNKNNVIECTQRKVISKYAMAGFYYYKNKDIFINSCSEVLLSNDDYKGEFFICSSINQIILMGKKVSAFKISSEKHFSLFSPKMIKRFENSVLAKSLILEDKSNNEINIVIPAAGKGSRFAKEGWKSPKPFININGKPMLQNVIDNLEIKNGQFHLIIQEEHLQNQQFNFSTKSKKDIKIIPINFHTSGTACTVLHARSEIETDKPLLIANSDQILDIDFNLFINDALSRKLDGSILVFKDKYKDPKWSFAKLNGENLVVEVAEKKPISNLATVGIYFFKTGKLFVDGALEMIKRDERINNEFYTCPIYNHLIKKGKKIGIFEVDCESMHGIGTPNDLQDYLKKMNFANSLDQP